MSRFRYLLLLAALLPAIGFSRAAQAGWLDDVKQGGYVLVIRHGATFSNQADTDPLNIKNVAAQRQLNDQGRAQAKAMGEAMHSLKIPVGSVTTSMFQRAVDTGKLLGFGDVQSTLDVSEGGLVVTPDENARRTHALRKLAGTPPSAGTNAIIVTHKPNITDAFGKEWFDIREGETSVFRPDGNGGYKLVVRIQASEWSGLSK